MNDRELMELAAKAAGIKLIVDPNGIFRDCTNSHPLMNIFSLPEWSPLTDAGDGLRLAEKLRISIVFRGSKHFVGVNYPMDICREGGINEVLDGIFRTAVEIGKSMK